MVELSKKESALFGLNFGRLNIAEDFGQWDLLNEELRNADYKFIRVKIQNPKGPELDSIKSICKHAHLLEILRVYKSADLLVTPFENEHSDLRFELVNEQNIKILEQLVYDTYDDMPFGNYTPAAVVRVFPPKLQLQGIIEYFKENYTGKDPDKVAYIAFLDNGKPVGCSISDYFEQGTYSYYVGVDRNERNRGIQYKIVNHIKFYTTARNKSYLCGSTRLTNLYSARTMEKTGCKCTGYDWVFLLEL